MPDIYNSILRNSRRHRVTADDIASLYGELRDKNKMNSADAIDAAFASLPAFVPEPTKGGNPLRGRNTPAVEDVAFKALMANESVGRVGAALGGAATGYIAARGARDAVRRVIQAYRDNTPLPLRGFLHSLYGQGRTMDYIRPKDRQMIREGYIVPKENIYEQNSYNPVADILSKPNKFNANPDANIKGSAQNVAELLRQYPDIAKNPNLLENYFYLRPMMNSEQSTSKVGKLFESRGDYLNQSLGGAFLYADPKTKKFEHLIDEWRVYPDVVKQPKEMKEQIKHALELVTTPLGKSKSDMIDEEQMRASFLNPDPSMIKRRLLKNRLYNIKQTLMFGLGLDKDQPATSGSFTEATLAKIAEKFGKPYPIFADITEPAPKKGKK